jgi:hypothetical protein
MLDPYLPVLALVGLALLAVLCLPFARLRKLVLELSALGLRLALLALLGAAAYLWFQPGNLPAEVADTSNAFLSACPRLKGLPEPGTPYFGVCAAAFVVVVLLPVLAVLDVSRKLAGWRLRRLRDLAVAPPVVAAPPATAPVYRANRRSAADTLAEAAARKPE